jgi:hypothetical protein
MDKPPMLPSLKQALIKALLANRISLDDLALLRRHINEVDLSEIIQKIYDLNKTQVYELAALEKAMALVDGMKNSNRNARFTAKINQDFRKGTHKVILAEGDSWFNYPVILSDVIDWVGMEDNLAVYSLASGGDWLLNMLNAKKYVEELSVMHPDVFLMSAGGNDLVGRSRLAAVVDPGGSSGEFEQSAWAVALIRGAKVVPLDRARFANGARFISKDFYALLMFFDLQYYFLLDEILTGRTGDGANSKFPGIQVITQGYDYALPSHQLGFGWNPLHWFRPFIRMFLGHGSWLKTPLQMRGILDPQDQKDIVYAMIYLFNEMMINTGKLFCNMPNVGSKVFHIDSRGSIGPDGWTDELHALPVHFKQIGQTFIDCINGEISRHGQVFVVNELHPYPKKKRI